MKLNDHQIILKKRNELNDNFVSFEYISETKIAFKMFPPLDILDINIPKLVCNLFKHVLSKMWILASHDHWQMNSMFAFNIFFENICS